MSRHTRHGGLDERGDQLSHHMDTDQKKLECFVFPSHLLSSQPSKMVRHLHVSYNDIHNLIRDVTPKITAEFNPDLMIAIGKTADYIFLVFSQCIHYFPLLRRRVSILEHKFWDFSEIDTLNSGFFPARVMVGP